MSDLDDALALLGLDLPPGQRPRDLPPVEVMLLGAALALLDLPALLVVDDVDEVGARADVDRAWTALRALADHCSWGSGWSRPTRRPWSACCCCPE